MPSPVITALVTGRRALDRETAIAARLAGSEPCIRQPAAIGSDGTGSHVGGSDFSGSDFSGSHGTGSHHAAAGAPPAAPAAVIIEGLADPHSPLADAPGVQIHRIAPGCLCCAGNVVLRVTLNRLLRRPPAQLYISLADATHVGQLRAMLSAPPYDTLLSLCDDVAAPAFAS